MADLNAIDSAVERVENIHKPLAGMGVNADALAIAGAILLGSLVLAQAIREFSSASIRGHAAKHEGTAS